MFTTKRLFNATNHDDKETRPRNPKITALIDESLNDNPLVETWRYASQKSLSPSIAVKQTSSSSSSSTIPRPNPQQIVPPQPSTEIIAEVFPSITKKDLPTPLPPYVVNELFPQAGKSSPRTKEDIIGGFSGDESDDEEHEHSDTESIDIADIHTKVKFLPATVYGLVKSLRELFTEFIREGKHEHRNALVFLLDELLRQEGIGRKQYKQLNTMLAESLVDDVEEEMAADAEDNEVKKVIQSTFHDIIQHDEEELMELLAGLKDEAGNDDYIDTLLKVEEPIDVFLSIIDGLMKSLEGYPISKSKQHRLKMLMDDINSNRHRVQFIFKQLGDAQDKNEILFILKQWVRE